MPNHVHVLIQAYDDLSKIVQSWKSYTGKWALQRNRTLELGIPADQQRFWQAEYWDRFIRNEEHFNRAIEYILRNPKSAGLDKNAMAHIYTGHTGKSRTKLELHPSQIKMVMTRGKDDEKALYDLLGSKDERKKFDTQFKNAESNFKIAIVVDMWLTGFDVPFLDTIYIDKPVQRHNLIQTISRVNRKFENKKKGLVVDYIPRDREGQTAEHQDQTAPAIAQARHRGIQENQQDQGGGLHQAVPGTGEQIQRAR